MSSSTSNPILGVLLYDLQVTKYMSSAGLTVILYDWFLTLSVEMRYIWQARWTVVKVIFLINRYFAPVTIAFGIYGWSGKSTWIEIKSCKAYILTDAFCTLLFFSGLHWIVAMRAWALWSRTYTMGVVIWGFFFLYLSATAIVIARSLISYTPTLMFGINVCFGVLPDYLWIIWLPSIAFETLIFVFTAIKAFQHNKKKVETPVLTTLYRDGFLYFIFISMNSFLNLLIWAVAPQSYVVLFKFFSTAISAVAGAHLVLDLIHVGHLSGAGQRTGQPPPKTKGLPGFGGFGRFGYAQSHGEVFEMVSAPSFMQDPPEYNQTIDQVMMTTRSINDWVAPMEWRPFHDRTSVTMDNITRSRTGLLMVTEQEASRDKAGQKLSGSKAAISNSSWNSTQSKVTEALQRRVPKISTPIVGTLVKNGIPNSPSPALLSPATYYSEYSAHSQQLPSITASGSRSPQSSHPSSPTSPTRERSVRFSQHQRTYRSSPQVI